MAIETQCSGCGQRLAVADEHAGKQARCPSCGQVYTVAVHPPETPITAELDPGLAETTAGTDSTAGEALTDQQFWMQTGDGAQYGPVDRANLNRWFSEGRVGKGYQIREGQVGPWQPADLFRPFENAASAHAVAASGNPYADQPMNPAATAQAGRQVYQQFPKGDPSSLVLTMGILSWVLLLVCGPLGWIPGLIAWINGGRALKDIQAGEADPTNTALVKVGYYLGMSNVLLSLLGICLFFGVIAIGIIADM